MGPEWVLASGGEIAWVCLTAQERGALHKQARSPRANLVRLFIRPCFALSIRLGIIRGHLALKLSHPPPTGEDNREVALEVVRSGMHPLPEVLEQKRRLELRGDHVGGFQLRTEALQGERRNTAMRRRSSVPNAAPARGGGWGGPGTPDFGLPSQRLLGFWDRIFGERLLLREGSAMILTSLLGGRRSLRPRRPGSVDVSPVKKDGKGYTIPPKRNMNTALGRGVAFYPPPNRSGVP